LDSGGEIDETRVLEREEIEIESKGNEEGVEDVEVSLFGEGEEKWAGEEGEDRELGS